MTNSDAISGRNRMRPVVVFVDDDEYICDAFARALRCPDWEVAAFTAPRAALDFIRTSGNVFIVVSDLAMPGMSGIEFLESVKSLNARVFRILLTGNPDAKQAIDAFESGIVNYFATKPWNPDKIRKTIGALLKDFATNGGTGHPRRPM